jgi:membrane fusion protein (multidrug efflux system)
MLQLFLFTFKKMIRIFGKSSLLMMIQKVKLLLFRFISWGRSLSFPVLLGGGVFCLLFLYKVWTYQAPPGDGETKVVEVEVLEPQTIRQTTEVIGTIRSGRQTTLIAKSHGILHINAPSGTLLKKGALIASLENIDREENVRLLEEAVTIAQAQLQRVQVLIKSGSSSKHLLEERKSALLEAQKNLSDAKIALADLQWTAPFDGVVGFFKIREGSHVDMGTMIGHFYDPSSFVIEFDLPLAIATQLPDTATVIVQDKTYPLTYIQKMLDEDTHMCPASVQIDCPRCIVGSTQSVRLILQEKKNALVIPLDALVLEGHRSYVYVAQDQKALRKPVTLGIRDQQRIEVTQGLEAGDILIRTAPHRLYPEAPIKIYTPPTPTKERPAS